eukprot:TRINITY_DN114407_c0_g1_i1.p2 TRINITY_DN114407_c0_g1~~TRINITY_DN114407_c0_g1_i1.p2  ORF type:complete len:108 (-),score=5.38 TRINITY_DN114407_c0_g1_i1:224-547(-)
MWFATLLMLFTMYAWLLVSELHKKTLDLTGNYLFMVGARLLWEKALQCLGYGEPAHAGQSKWGTDLALDSLWSSPLGDNARGSPAPEMAKNILFNMAESSLWYYMMR